MVRARAAGRGMRVGLLVLVIGWGLAARAADVPRPEHPRPDAERAHWANLNGTWQFRFDAQDEGRQAEWFKPDAGGFDRSIVVPFGWESELSGIHQPKGAPKVGWYRRTFKVPADFPAGDRVWLHFGAVDYQADAWVNGQHVASHEGGYSPFAADVTDAIKRDGENTLVVRAFDPTDPHYPTGKQIGWYTPTSGIWQTVWLEARPKAHIAQFTIKTAIDPASATIDVVLDGLSGGSYTVSALPTDAAVQPASSSLAITPDTPAERRSRDEVTLKLPVREARLWTPETPHLYDVVLALKDNDGKVIDSIKTYFGLRTIARGKYGDEPFERLLLNGKPIYLRGALDQSFNPKGIYTAPSDEFLKRDIELAKSLGLNGLRIHIKPDEPRRLYWADRLGLLIMEDMPNTWVQDATARQAWEKTMREVVARDRNHPAIICWVDFNETWGLGKPADYKADRDTQRWVQAMVAETKNLDPTRLVEDNSPCNYDHVEGTDLNSWHFYIDDHERSRQHVEEVVAKTEPGSAFNYCPGLKQSTAPLINSEYGSVSAGSGDRDVSWGFRDLTTLLRKQPKIQGYIYTELDDIEWEHNGYVNYDRSPKQFGYDAFVPGMTVADLQGADFIGYDGPPAIVAKPGEVVRVPLFVSHFSDRRDPPRLRWWVSGVDGDGQKVELPAQERPVTWTPFGVTPQKPVAFKIAPGPFVGALALSLEDSSGRRIAANFVNVWIKPDRPEPRAQRVDDHLVAVRFSPGDFARSHWSGQAGAPGGAKACGRGKGGLMYRLRLPKAVVDARPDSFQLLFEASARAGRERVDWPDRVNRQDNPQTDTRKWPSTLEVTLNGQRVARVELTDDPADARGVLSHLARVDHGSYGELIRLSADLPNTAQADLASGGSLVIRFNVPDDAEHAGGLCLFGAEVGAYPIDPTLILHTERPMPANLGVRPDQPVTIDAASARQAVLLPAGDATGGSPTSWAYTTSDPGPDWTRPDFDDRAWARGPAGFGTPGTPALKVATRWDTPNVWLRTTVELPEIGDADLLSLHLFHDEDVTIYVNGRRLLRARGYLTGYQDTTLDATQKALFHPGRNTLAVSCHQTGGGQGIDLGLRLLKMD